MFKKSLFFAPAFCLSFIFFLPASAYKKESRAVVFEQQQNAVPLINLDKDLSEFTPEQQVKHLSQNLGIQLPTAEFEVQQKRMAKELIQLTALQYAVPPEIALALSGHESAGWKMWLANGKTQSYANRVHGELHSSDWGLMQINDRAHPQRFPRARQDMLFNIVTGIEYLAQLHQNIQGSLGSGFGDWDATLAAYHLGHRPQKHELQQAKTYLKKIQRYGQRQGILYSYLYQVKEGDSLGRIAQRQLGDFTKWESIQQLNPDIQAKTLLPGQQIRIPFR